ncbi:hypothetical protein QR680_012862 [Steinernema hermaphroditum]|uniref:Helitron helicase-like domain-containing protein n=1 Tax=Steinernema hermaphroditum TaxID=289476 RepID=A0AA39I3J4_9BILA|nr:hypothetical protein QR680_012862 [Steinernema hermaphroditum]
MTSVDSSGKNYGFKEDDDITSEDVEEVVADFGSNEDLDAEEPPATLDFDDQCADLQAPENQTPDSDAEEDAKEDAEVTWEDQDDYVPGEGDDEDEDMQQYAERIGKGRRYLSNRLFVRFRTRRPALGIFHCYAVWDMNHQQRPLPRKIFLLPYSYPGGKAYMQRKFLDTMAISARVGAPSFYVTFAGNPEWPEIIHQRKHEKQPLTELYDIQWRVFLRKLNELKKNLKQCFGEQVGMAMSIEQQRTFDDQSKSDTLFATL